jgi:hypothetical protein
MGCGMTGRCGKGLEQWVRQQPQQTRMGIEARRDAPFANGAHCDFHWHLGAAALGAVKVTGATL